MGRFINQAGNTFPKILRVNAEQWPEEICMRKKDFGIWNQFTWKDVWKKVGCFAIGLKALGFEYGDKMSIVGDNDPQWIWGQLAAQSLGGIAVGIFSDATPEEIKYIVGNSDSKIVLANDQEQVDKLLQIKEDLPLLEKVIYWDDKGLRNYDDPILEYFDDILKRGETEWQESSAKFEEFVDRGKKSDMCLLLYTSGTTGLPKGVMISHGSMINGTLSMLKVFEVKHGDNLISCFPAAWMGEQLFSIASFLLAGAILNYPEEPETLQNDLREISPTMVVFGPKQWEHICSDIQVKMKDADILKRTVYRLFLPIARKKARYSLDKKEIPLWLRMAGFLGKQCVFKQLMDKIGLRKTKIFITGSASISPDIFEFMHALGIHLRQAYAGTECGFAFGHQEKDIKPESVGIPAPGIKAKIADDRELLIGGETIFTGYYKNEEETEKVLRDGWFHTGDACVFSDDGHLIYIDRVSELGELSDGTTYSPQYIEGRLRFNPYIKDSLVVGRKEHPFISVIVNIDFDMVGKWAEDNKINYTTFVDLSQKEEVSKLVIEDLRRVNSLLPEENRVRRFAVLHKEFDADEGELTRTRKIKRKIVEEKYGDLIDAIYGEGKELKVKAHVKYRDGRTAVVETILKIRDIL